MATAEMYNANIIIHYERGNTLQLSPQNGTPNLQINIAFRLQDVLSSNFIYIHYDSIVISAQANTSQGTQSTQPYSIHSANSGHLLIQAKVEINQNRLLCPTQQPEAVDKVTTIPRLTNLLSWNVRGCCRQETRNDIDDILKKKNVDVAFLQETKMIRGKAKTDGIFSEPTTTIRRTEESES